MGPRINKREQEKDRNASRVFDMQPEAAKHYPVEVWTERLRAESRMLSLMASNLDAVARELEKRFSERKEQ